MMDAGSYCVHASRALAAAAGAPGPLVVTSAAAKLRPGSSTVDGECGVPDAKRGARRLQEHSAALSWAGAAHAPASRLRGPECAGAMIVNWSTDGSQDGPGPSGRSSTGGGGKSSGSKASLPVSLPLCLSQASCCVSAAGW